MTRDYYTEAYDIVRCLEQDDLNSEAAALVNAIESGSTGTEILMALRWELQRIDESNLALSSHTRRRILDLGSAIAVALDG
jgi:uncharacterized protein with GYD domain